VSCKKVWEALTEKNVLVEEEVNAAKDTIKGDGVWELVKDAEKVFVTSGKKILEFIPSKDKEEMLSKMRGRTGNLRAPTAKTGNIYYVGFNEELYRDRIG